jgi:hypothetical protein
MPPEMPPPGPLAGVALLFALPLTREAYDLSVLGRALPDYGAQLRNASDGPAAFWEGSYRHSARWGAALADEAQALGAHVYRRATLSELSEATSLCRTIILFAHMSGPYFNLGQLPRTVADRHRLMRRLEEHQVVAAPAEAEDPEAMIEALNNLIRHRRLLPWLPDMIRADAEISPTRGEALCRDLLDEWLDGLVTPGNRVELYDGMHTPGSLASAFAPDFAGEVDFAICNSAVVAAVIEMRTGKDVRIGARGVLTVPRPEFFATAQALRLAAGGTPYLQARALVAAKLGEQGESGWD